MSAALQSAQGHANWDVASVQAFLMGENEELPQCVWKAEQLARFDSHPLPCWVLRCVSEAPGLAGMGTAILAACCARIQQLHDT